MTTEESVRNPDEGRFSPLTWLGVGVLFIFAVVVAVFAVWLVVEAIEVLSAAEGDAPAFDFLGFDEDLGTDPLMLLLALGAGVIGGLIHFITSLAKYAGSQEFLARWTLWYLARPVLGGLLAVIVYLVIRAGLLPSAGATDVISPYGVAAFAGLAGMFSKQAIDWFERLFNTAFARSDRLPDSLEGDRPEIDMIAVEPDEGGAYLSIVGRGFGETGAQVIIGREVRAAEMATDKMVRVPLSDADRRETALRVRVLRNDGAASAESSVDPGGG